MLFHSTHNRMPEGIEPATSRPAAECHKPLSYDVFLNAKLRREVLPQVFFTACRHCVPNNEEVQAYRRTEHVGCVTPTTKKKMGNNAPHCSSVLSLQSPTCLILKITY